jgi:hypothetical protein
MRLDKAGKTLLIGAASATLLLTGCGSSGTISSLTDSDQTASIAVETAVEVATEVPADTAGGNGAVTSVPEIVPQTIVGTSTMSVPDLTVATETPAAGNDASSPAAVTTGTDTAAEETAKKPASSEDGEIALLGDEAEEEKKVADTSEDEEEAEETEAQEEEDEESSEGGGTAYITGDEVNVREEPTTDNGDDNVMFTVSEGDEVKILDREDNWVKISVNGEVGWVSSAYVE